MANKFPTSQSFQRLNNIPLDETMVFDTLAQAQDYANNNPTAYKGQVVHVKDARTDSEINEGVFIYEETCYITYNKEIRPICTFNYQSLSTLLSILDGLVDAIGGDLPGLLEILKDQIYNNYTLGSPYGPATGDYHTQPWHPDNYADDQLCYRIDPSKEEPATIVAYTESGYGIKPSAIEKITVMHNGVEEHYRVITLPSKPESLSFTSTENDGYLEIIHMWDTSHVVRLEGTFYDCKNLTRIHDINKWDVSNCKTFYQAFYGCDSLTHLDLSGWNTSSVTNMSQMFYGCKNLSSLDLSNWDTSNVTDMSYMFNDCTSLQSLDLSNWDTSNVTDMWGIYGMFVSTPMLTWENIITTNCSETTIAQIKEVFDSSH